MKQLVALLIVGAYLSAYSQEVSGINFEKTSSWNEIKGKAKNDNKYIFMDLYATWCGPCKVMDMNVYPNDTVGKFMNKKFISVRLQMDSTENDDQQVKDRYDIVHKIYGEYKIEGFPCFLFFSPSGNLVYRDLGYKSVFDFINLARIALDPQTMLYHRQLEEYIAGKRDYRVMGGLGQYVGKVIGNYKLAYNIAEDYKINYLDELDPQALLTKESFEFIDGFSQLIRVDDNFFELCYSLPDKVDQIRNSPGWAMSQVKNAITRDVLDRKFLRGKTPIFKNPDWNSIFNLIKEKYSKIDAKKLVLDYQILYYSEIMDWRQWIKYKNERIRSYPPKPGAEADIELNDGGAWWTFLRCNDKKALSAALKWSDMLLKINRLQLSDNDIDTKADLLYKLGRTKKAILVEKEAMKCYLSSAKATGKLTKFPELITKDINKYKEMISAMRAGRPTYLDEGAIWDATTMPKKMKETKALGDILFFKDNLIYSY